MLAVALVATAACGDNIKGQLTPDGSVPNPDGPQADAAPDAPPEGPDTSAQIADARATADGTGLSLPIEEATVTYLKPQIGSTTNDPAGFTIQASQMGPAIFVSVDPATLIPPVGVGDVVSFTITELVTVGGQKRVAAIEAFSRDSTGADVGALAQDITAATDVVTALDDYDSEIIDITGTITGTFGFSGTDFERATITTTGIPAGDANYMLRVPATLRDALDIDTGCTFTLNNTPVGRFNAQAQLAAFTASDITLSGCPAPVVESAVAITATSVRVTFSRNILASSVMVDGSQFTFDNGLTATAATVNGNTVDVVTGAQTGGTTYTVTVANTVTDLQGTAVGTPNTATFTGFQIPAVVRINEVNANIASGCDLIELRVISGGTMNGIRVQERGANIYTFGSLNVATNDIIVVHFNGNSATCNTGGAVDETLIVGQPALTFPQNYDLAYDVYSTDTGLTSTDNTLTVVAATDAIIDVILVAQAATGTAAAASESAAAAAAAAMQWQMVGGGVPPGGFVDDDFRAHAVLDLDATGTSSAGETIRRIDNTDDNDKADWDQGAQSWGTLNPGQSLFL